MRRMRDRFIVLAFSGLIGVVGLSLPLSSPAPAQVVSPTPTLIAQDALPPLEIPLIFRNRDAWRLVYERMPELPLENQYISLETGEVATDDTLASRIIRYHLYVQTRIPVYRLDWKLTIADYLDANQWMRPELYPGATSLNINPFEADRAILQNMSRAERDRLVEALVLAFNPTYPEAEAATASFEVPSRTPAPPAPEPSQLSPPSLLPAPQPGDAQLLQF